jgi:hypothetical protein
MDWPTWAERVGFEYHWRYTALRVRFLKLDVYGVLPMFTLLIYRSWFIFIFSTCLCIFTMWLEKKGVSLPDFYRRCRLYIGGYWKTKRIPNI